MKPEAESRPSDTGDKRGREDSSEDAKVSSSSLSEKPQGPILLTRITDGPKGTLIIFWGEWWLGRTATVVPTGWTI